MGIYREHFTSSDLDRDPAQEWDTWEIYEQPAWRHYAHVALDAITDRTHMLEYRLDPLAKRLHKRRCNDDCVTGVVRRVKPYWRTPEGQAERERIGFVAFFKKADAWESTVETFCGWGPLCLEVDLLVRDFGQKQRRKLGTLDGPKRPFDYDGD